MVENVQIYPTYACRKYWLITLNTFDLEEHKNCHIQNISWPLENSNRHSSLVGSPHFDVHKRNYVYAFCCLV